MLIAMRQMTLCFCMSMTAPVHQKGICENISVRVMMMMIIMAVGQLLPMPPFY